MQIEILLFGQLAEAAGQNKVRLEDVADSDTLIKQLHTLFPELAKKPYVVAVDKDIISENTSLEGKNTVALLPPYAGG